MVKLFSSRVRGKIYNNRLSFLVSKISMLTVVVLLTLALPATADTRPSSAMPAASTCTITSTADSGPGTFRECLTIANTGDTISFDPTVFPPGSPATIAPDTTLPWITQGLLTIDASNAGVILDGSGVVDPDPDGLIVDSSGNTIMGLQIINFPRLGINVVTEANNNTIGGNSGIGSSPTGQGNLFGGNGGAIFIGGVTGAHNNIIKGNLIGTDTTGTSPFANGNGVLLRFGSTYNQIGSTFPGERNIISGSTTTGVQIMDPGTDFNVVIGNYIGTDITGTASIGNEYGGVWIMDGAQDNRVGGTTPAERNLLSGNVGTGVSITNCENNVVIGNYIGVDVTGSVALPNVMGGVDIANNASLNTIGGDSEAERNIISGNLNNGVALYDLGTSNNTVSGNFIGTDVSGTNPIANATNGVYLVRGAQSNTIGGSSPSERNIISGNTGNGVIIQDNDTFSNTVSGNYIGTDATGTQSLPNGDGIRILSSFDNTIGGDNASPGGDCSGACNLISGNAGHGLTIAESDSSNNIVSGNYIGTDVSGTAAIGNDSGVFIANQASNNTIGGDTPAERNVISGNRIDGIDLFDPLTTGNVVSGNYIGTDASGILPLPNASNGISISDGASDNLIGGDTSAERNVISGNGPDCPWCDGIFIGNDAHHNTVQGNYIGTDASGTVALGNNSMGVDLYERASDNVIRENLISGNGEHGITIWNDSTRNLVIGNLIGTNASGTVATSNVYDGIFISSGASDNIIGGDTPDERNVVSGNGSIGVNIWSSNNTVSGNYIGTDSTGTNPLSNGYEGVSINGASNNTIGGLNASPGGSCSGECNLISGNDREGVWIGLSGTTSNTISGNYIGTDVNGEMIVGNERSGIHIENGGSYTLIGGSTPGERNLISGNGGNGVSITGDETINNTLIGNYIGLDVSGGQALPNGLEGISINNWASYNLIGGDSPGEGNVISGNGPACPWCDGIYIGDDAHHNTVQGNYIGTDASGTVELGNNSMGVDLYERASDNDIRDNLISGNGKHGVAVWNDSTRNLVTGNLIGTDISATNLLPNAGNGISISDGANDNLVGGPTVPDGNTIGHNGGHGVFVAWTGTLYNTISHNSIHDNAGLGIKLHEGGNDELPSPVIVTANLAAGTVSGTACANCIVEIFSDNNDEGREYEGQVVANGAGDFAFAKGAPLAGPNLTATATDADGNTSEFAAPWPVVNTPPSLAGLPDQLFDQNRLPPDAVDLWAFAGDGQTPVSGLIYTIEGTPPTGVGVTITDNRDLEVNPSFDWCGYYDVTVRVTDPDGLWDEDVLRVAVTWVCKGPLPVPDQSAPQDQPIALDLTTFEPQVGDGTGMLWYVTDEDHCTVSGERSEDDVLTFTPQLGFLGSDVITLHMTYPMGGNATQELTLAWWIEESQGFKLFLPVAIRNH